MVALRNHAGTRDGSVGARALLLAARVVISSLLVLASVSLASAQEQGAAPPAQKETGSSLAGGASTEPMPLRPLAPVLKASPRQTFTNFRRLARQAEASLLAALKQAGSNDAIFDTPQIRALKRQALDDLIKAASTLDLSAVAPASRRTVGISSVLLLKEIMDRIPLPALQDVPGPTAVDAGAAAHGWSVPGTEIRMTRTKGADGTPRFLFSADTVSRLPEFYARVRDLPRQPTSSIDFYQSFALGPGLSMPIEFYRYVLSLPGWMLVDYHEQAVWQWIGFAGLTAIAALLIFLLLRREARRQQPTNTVTRSVQRMVAPFGIILMLAVYRWLSDNFINLTGEVLADLVLAVLVLQAIAFSVIIVLAFNAIAELVISMPSIRQESLDASLIRLVLRVVGILVAGYVLALTATRIGIPLYGIIASLGVGGLALALAVRPTLENFIGGIILYADRPVKVGDFCKFGDKLGTVEAIGLRSTKVRGLDRTLVTVQNADFAQMSITNFTRRDSNLMHNTIALRYETTGEQISAVVDGIAEMLRSDERVKAETVRVCLREFGAYSLNIEIWAYVKCPDWARFLKIQEELFMRVIDVVRDNGCAFALPSQTTYLEPDRLTSEHVAALQQIGTQAAANA